MSKSCSRLLVALLALVAAAVAPAQAQVNSIPGPIVTRGATCPPVATPSAGAGAIYTCTGTGAAYVWNGSAWIAAGGGGTFDGSIAGGQVAVGTGANEIGGFGSWTGSSLTVSGNQLLSQVADPPAPVVTSIGEPGIQNDEYVVVHNILNSHTAPSPAGVTLTANATLDDDNFNRITFTPTVSGGTYSVYRTAGGDTAGLIAEGLTAPFVLDDTGLVGDGNDPPSTNTTGTITVNGIIVPDGSDDPLTATVRLTTYPFGLFGFTPNTGLTSFGPGLVTSRAQTPTVPVALALGSEGVVTDGVHEIYLGFEDESGDRTDAFLAGTIEVTDNKEIEISDIQVGSTVVNDVVIYVTKAGETGAANAHEVTTVNNGTRTYTFTDPDENLTGDRPPSTNESLVAGLFVTGIEWGIGDWQAGYNPYIHAFGGSSSFIDPEIINPPYIDISAPSGHVNISADAGLDVYTPSLTISGTTTGDITVSGSSGVVTAKGLAVSGLTTPTNKPVCFDADGKLYAGTNDMGVLSCP